METITTMAALIEAARQRGPVSTAVAVPHDDTTILAVADGLRSGLLEPVLFGNANCIRELLQKHCLDEKAVRVEDAGSQEGAVCAAVAAVREGKTRLLMKGAVATPVILREALRKDTGIGRGRLCSYIAVCEVPGLGRLILNTDGGLNIAPNLREKTDIVKNAVEVARSLGIRTPRVAVLAAVEDVNPAMQATIDAACLSKMADRGVFGDALVDGPLALDNIFSGASAGKKGITSAVAGKADIVVSPTIEVGNALGKSMTYLAGSTNAGVVVGAKAPMIIPSRAGTAEAKVAALAVGVLLAAGD